MPWPRFEVLSRSCLLALLLSSSLLGCGGDDSPGEKAPKTGWLSQGTGEANTEPLLPLRAGGRSLGLFGDAVVEDGARRLLRLVLEQGGRAQRVELLLGEGKEGVEIHGSEGARFDRPVLFVPNTVRVGMRWRIQVPGQSPSELEVVRREETDTPFGRRPLWRIEEYADDSKDAISRFAFLEGLGLIGTAAGSFQPRVILPEARLEDAPVAPKLSASSRTPFVVGPTRYAGNYVEGDGFGDNLSLTSMGLVVPAGSKQGTLIVKGMRSCAFASDSGFCFEEACFDVAATGASPTQRPSVVQGFYQGSGCNKHYREGREEVTNDASGALVSPSGVYWVPRAANGSLLNGAIAPYADPETTEPRLLVYTQDELVPQMRAVWADYDVEARSFSAVSNDSLVGQWVVPFLERFGTTGSQRPVWGWTLSAPGEKKVLFAASDNERVLYHSELDGDTLTPIEPVSSVLGALSTTASEAGHSLLVASPGGRVDRIVAESGSLSRESIARIELEPNERLVGAVDLAPLSPDHVLVATWRPAAANSKDVQGNLGTVSFHKLDKQAPVPWEWPKGAAVVARQRSKDVVVCWPPTSEALERDGWKLGGVPAEQVLEVKPGSCALIVRDVDADPVLKGSSLVGMGHDEAIALYGKLRYDVEGPVPGVGVAWVAPDSDPVQPLATGDAAGRMTPLENGGYATPFRLYGPGGLPLALPENPSRKLDGVSDLSGAGVWLVEDSTLRLYGPEPQDLALESDVGVATPRFADPNGGLVLAVDSAWYHFDTDGTRTELPTPPLPGMVWSARRRSGELCGVYGPELICVDDQSGAETARDVGGDFANVVGLLDDDSMLVRIQDDAGVHAMRRWIPGSPLEPWEDRLIHTFEPTLDGKVWCVLHEDGGPYEPGYCTADGFEPVDLESKLAKRFFLFANYYKDIYRVVEGKDELWVESFGCFNGCSSQWNRLPWP